MKIPLKYTMKSLMTRKLTTIITVSGVALVVFVFAAVLMMSHGVQKTLVSTGEVDNVMVLRKSSQSEISSIIGGDTQNIIRTLPHIAKASNNQQIISTEPVVIINLEIKSGGVSNLTVRGVSPIIQQVRPKMKITSGRMFNPSLRELIVGEKLISRFEGAQIGKKIRFAADDWTVVGVFTTEGSGFDSEFWGDATQLLEAFNRSNSVSTMTIKLDNIANYDKFKRAFETDRRLQQFEVKPEQKFFEEQSQFLSQFISILGTFITIIFSFGATIGAAITMYAAVANRTVEIGTLRSLGFARRSILSSFLFESIIIAMIGAFFGLFFASFLQFFSISTLNFNSFSELSFSFALSSEIFISSLVFALIMGLIGGFAPAVRASRLNIVTALRGL
jgi:ABC-type antimicrobial peptide transport system permease subunit